MQKLGWGGYEKELINQSVICLIEREYIMYQILFDGKERDFDEFKTKFNTSNELVEFLSTSKDYDFYSQSSREFPLFYHYNNNEFENISIIRDDIEIYNSKDCILGEYEVDLIGGYSAHGFSKKELLDLIY